MQDVCDRAGIGRSTFYAHYADKEDLLIGGLDVCNDLHADAAAARGPRRPFRFLGGLLAHAGASRRWFRAVIGNTSAMMSLALAATLAAGCHHGPSGHHGPSDHGPSGHHAPAASQEALTEAAIPVPIRADRTAAWEAALRELVGPRYEEYRASRTRFGLTSQTTFLQHTPMGDLALIHLTGPDVHRAFHAMSSSREPWDVKWREMTLDLHGIDFTQGTRVMPAITKAFEMASGDVAGTSPFLFAVPIDPQRIADVRALAAELTGPRRAEYARSRERIGVRRELAFLETSGAGAALVFYWRAADPQASPRRLVDSTEPFDRWLAEAVAPLHPVPLAPLAGGPHRGFMIRGDSPGGEAHG